MSLLRRAGPLFLLWASALAAVHFWQEARFFTLVMGDMPAPSPWPGSWGAAPLWAAHLARTAGAALLLLIARETGRRILSRLRSAAGGLAAECGLGLAIWSLLGFTMSLLGLSHPWALRAATVAGALLVLRKDSFRFSPAPAIRPVLLPAALLLSVFALLWMTTITPEIFCDPLSYVLPLAEAALREGRWTELPTPLARLPGLSAFSYLWGLAWGDDRLCKLMSLGTGALWAGAVWTAAGRRAGPWAALLLAAAPFAGASFWTSGQEPLAGLLVLAAYLVWNDAWDQEDAARRRSLVLLAGLCLGAACAAKYTAAFGAPYFAGDFLLRRWRGKLAVREAGLFLAGAVLPLLPWWIQNALATGNPFFPLAGGWWGTADPVRDHLLARCSLELGSAGKSWLYKVLSFPVNSLTGVWDGRSSFLGPLFLILLPATPLVWKDPGVRRAAAYALVSYLAMTAATRTFRYYTPHLGIACLWAGPILARLARGGATWRRGFAVLVGGVILSQILALALIFHVFYHGWGVVTGKVSPETYLREEHAKTYATPPLKAYESLRGKKGKVYIVGDTRTFRCPIPYENTTPFVPPRLDAWFKASPSADGVVDRLREGGFTFLLINVPEMERALAPEYLTPEWKGRLADLCRRLAPPVYQDAWTLVFRIPPEKEPR